MKIAFTSNDGTTIDEHFGMTRDFYVWEIGPESSAFVGKVSALTASDDEEDEIAARANAIAGCAIVYTVQIGGPAAAKLVSRRILPMRTAAGVPIAEVVEKLRVVLATNPPPWLRKAMRGGLALVADE